MDFLLKKDRIFCLSAGRGSHRETFFEMDMRKSAGRDTPYRKVPMEKNFKIIAIRSFTE